MQKIRTMTFVRKEMITVVSFSFFVLLSVLRWISMNKNKNLGILELRLLLSIFPRVMLLQNAMQIICWRKFLKRDDHQGMFCGNQMRIKDCIKVD